MIARDDGSTSRDDDGGTTADLSGLDLAGARRCCSRQAALVAEDAVALAVPESERVALLSEALAAERRTNRGTSAEPASERPTE